MQYLSSYRKVYKTATLTLILRLLTLAWSRFWEVGKENLLRNRGIWQALRNIILFRAATYSNRHICSKPENETFLFCFFTATINNFEDFLYLFLCQDFNILFSFIWGREYYKVLKIGKNSRLHARKMTIWLTIRIISAPNIRIKRVNELLRWACSKFLRKVWYYAFTKKKLFIIDKKQTWLIILVV